MAQPIPRPSAYEESSDYYATGLFQTSINVQYCHHLTRSHETHVTLGKTYEDIEGLKDDILEKLMGCMGERYKSLNVKPCTGFSESMPLQVIKEAKTFTKKFMEWSDKYDYPDINNLLQEYFGILNKGLYLLSLK